MVKKLKSGETFSYYIGVLESHMTIGDAVEVWVDEEGFEHNENGLPSYIYYHLGEWYTKEHRVHGYRHNINGPAWYTINGDSEYWLNGKQLSKEVWEIEGNRIKTLEEI